MIFKFIFYDIFFVIFLSSCRFKKISFSVGLWTRDCLWGESFPINDKQTLENQVSHKTFLKSSLDWQSKYIGSNKPLVSIGAL